MRHPIYTRPDPSRMGDIDFVLDYAVNFDGYAYAHEHGIDIESLANDRLHRWQNCGEWQGTFEEMRLCLFVEQRLDRHVGRDPEIAVPRPPRIGDMLLKLVNFKAFRSISTDRSEFSFSRLMKASSSGIRNTFPRKLDTKLP